MVDRPLNSHGFTMCHLVSLPFLQSHGSFFISHYFTNFEQIFFKHRQQIPMLLMNTFLILLTKTKQAVAVLFFELGTIVHYVSEDTY